MKRTVIAPVIVLISYILPLVQVNVFGISYSVSLYTVLTKGSGVYKNLSNVGVDTTRIGEYLIILTVPAVMSVLALLSFKNQKAQSNLSLLNGTIILLLIIYAYTYMMNNAQISIFSYAGVGMWALIAGAVAGMIVRPGKPSGKNTK